MAVWLDSYDIDEVRFKLQARNKFNSGVVASAIYVMS
jgi:hypothetical protein